MKTMIKYILAFVLIFSTLGCNDSSGDSSGDTTGSTQTGTTFNFQSYFVGKTIYTIQDNTAASMTYETDFTFYGEDVEGSWDDDEQYEISGNSLIIHTKDEETVTLTYLGTVANNGMKFSITGIPSETEVILYASATDRDIALAALVAGNTDTDPVGSSGDDTVLSEDGNTLVYTINSGLQTYTQYTYTKTGDFNLSVTKGGVETKLALSSFTEKTETNYITMYRTLVETKSDFINVLTYRDLQDGLSYTKYGTVSAYLNFNLQSFPVDSPTTGTYTSDGLYINSTEGINDVISLQSFDVVVTTAEAVDDKIHLIGSFSMTEGTQDIAVSFDIYSQVNPEIVYK